ncbi:MAG: hypothetical protein WBK76_05615 [Candidatus Saccharimonadales bacterium]
MSDLLIARFAQPLLYLTASLAAVMFYINGMLLTEAGQIYWLPIGMLLISPLMMALLRIAFEGPLTRSFFDPRTMSWSFVVGDLLLLPAALWFAGLGWRQLDLSAQTKLVSAGTYVAAGIIVMVMFRKLDGDRYREAGCSLSLKSPTKVWHDCVVMPVVVALGMWLLAPQLLMERSWYTVVAVVLLGGFFLLNLIDALNQPDPRRQHPLWDTTRFEPIDSN